MHEIKQSKLSRAEHSMFRWLLVPAVAGLLAGAIESCKPTPPEYVTPDVCLKQIHVRELLGTAARHAATLGRLDPYAYSVGADGMLTLTLDEQSSTSTPTPELLRAALANIDADPTARRAFAENQAAAKEICPESTCPRGPFSVSVTPNTSVSKRREVYDFAFPREPPPEEVLKAFGVQFNYLGSDALECRNPPAVDSARKRIYSVSGNCDSDWPPGSPGDRCSPPRKGHWEEDGEDLCCY